MNDAIIVYYDVFASESRVTLYQDNKRKDLYVASSIPELVAELEKISNQHNLYNVKISAPNAFIGEIAREVSTKYANSKLQIGSI